MVLYTYSGWNQFPAGEHFIILAFEYLQASIGWCKFTTEINFNLDSPFNNSAHRSKSGK